MTLSLEDIRFHAQLLEAQEKLLLIDDLQRQLQADLGEVHALWQAEVADRIKADANGLLETLELDEVLAKYKSQ